MDSIKVGLAQIAPIWCDREATTEKITRYIADAATKGCGLVVFGEGTLPGYPFWLSTSNGSNFNNPVQKEIFAHYAQAAVVIERGDLDSVCASAKEHGIAVYLGIIERPMDRSGHSLYCSLVYINNEGTICSVHRKLCPTYEERLVWSPGDGNGLTTHPLPPFTVGGLNCWENWMPLARTALYAQGENLHVAVWPGAKRITEDITRFAAKEGRSFFVSVSGLMRKSDYPENTPHLNVLLENNDELIADGGSCVAHPDGSWVLEPQCDEEGLYEVDLNINEVFAERQNFDPTGHYSRPDVLKMTINKDRQHTL